MFSVFFFQKCFLHPVFFFLPAFLCIVFFLFFFTCLSLHFFTVTLPQAPSACVSSVGPNATVKKQRGVFSTEKTCRAYTSKVMVVG